MRIQNVKIRPQDGGLGMNPTQAPRDTLTNSALAVIQKT